jgi:hypothetical protein
MRSILIFFLFFIFLTSCKRNKQESKNLNNLKLDIDSVELINMKENKSIFEIDSCKNVNNYETLTYNFKGLEYQLPYFIKKIDSMSNTNIRAYGLYNKEELISMIDIEKVYVTTDSISSPAKHIQKDMVKNLLKENNLVDFGEFNLNNTYFHWVSSKIGNGNRKIYEIPFETINNKSFIVRLVAVDDFHLNKLLCMSKKIFKSFEIKKTNR